MLILNITGYPKPRETRGDIWAPRTCVKNYRAYKDLLREELQKNGFKLDNVLPFMVYVFPIPKSYSDKKRKELLGQPHTNLPDLDNLEKGFLDCIFDKISKQHFNFTKLSNDKEVHTKLGGMKVWGHVGRIFIFEKDQAYFDKVFGVLKENYSI
jgi:Holliday junction resolvase RusA-like endonuclease